MIGFRPLLCVTLAISLHEAAVADSLSAALKQKIDGIVQKDLRETDTPGLSLAIVRNGRMIYAKGYGVKDLATREPVDPQTIFRFGSVTKEFTAASFLLLQRDGKLTLDDPVAKWLPAATSAQDVRVVDLLSQVSGYRDYYPLDYVDREMSVGASTQAIAREYGRFALTAPPRRRWEYSSTNYLFAGLILERTSGERIGKLLHDRILAPLGMRRTFFDEPFQAVPDRATGYNSYFTEPAHEDTLEAPDWLNAAAALAGTASDLARWDIGLMNQTVVDRASVRTMTTERVLMPGGVHTHYGLGLSVRYRNGHRIVSHSGRIIGFNSSNLMAFDDRTAVVALANNYQALAAESAARHVLLYLMPELVPKKIRSSGSEKTRVPRLTSTQEDAVKLVTAGLRALRAGVLPESIADADFRTFMNRVNTERARSTLQKLGPVQNIQFVDMYAQGGLDVTTAEVRFRHGERSAALYATPQHKIAELFLFRE